MIAPSDAGGRRFGRRRDAQHDQAHHHEEHEAGRDHAHQRHEGAAGLAVDHVGSDVGRERGLEPHPQDDVDEEHAGEHEAGQDAGDQHLAGRHVGERRDDHRQHARRNDRVEAGAGEDRAGRELRVVAAPAHGGEERTPEQAGDRHGGARQRAEDRREHDAQHVLAAADAPDQPVERIEQDLHGAGAEQDLAHDDEQRHRRQRPERGGRIDAVGEQPEAGRAEQHEYAEHVEHHERDEDGHAEKEQRKQQHHSARQGDPPGHGGPPIGSAWLLPAPRWRRK